MPVAASCGALQLLWWEFFGHHRMPSLSGSHHESGSLEPAQVDADEGQEEDEGEEEEDMTSDEEVTEIHDLEVIDLQSEEEPSVFPYVVPSWLEEEEIPDSQPPPEEPQDSQPPPEENPAPDEKVLAEVCAPDKSALDEKTPVHAETQKVPEDSTSNFDTVEEIMDSDDDKGKNNESRGAFKVGTQPV